MDHDNSHNRKRWSDPIGERSRADYPKGPEPSPMFPTLESAKDYVESLGIEETTFGPFGFEQPGFTVIDGVAAYLHHSCHKESRPEDHIGTFLAMTGKDPMVYGYKLAGQTDSFRFEQKLWKEHRTRRLLSFMRRHAEDWFLVEVTTTHDLRHFEAAVEMGKCTVVLATPSGSVQHDGNDPQDAIHWALLDAGLIKIPDRINW